jgi:penicillin-binding protein 1A
MRPAPVLPPLKAQGRRRKKRSWLLGLITYLFAAGVLLFLGGLGVAGYYVWQASRDLPDYERLVKYEPPVMTRVHAADGTLMAEYAFERRIFVPINVIPDIIVKAFLAAEDRRFFEHGGLDFQGIARALYVNATRGGRAQGASTITQQVAKNLLLSNERTWDRKLKEAILAIRMERTFDKPKILELYLNEIYLGLGSYGVAAAALNYFGKELAELTLEEAAYIAALPKGPNNYHPLRQVKAATERRNWILDQMANNGFISKDQARIAKAKELKVNLRPFGTQIQGAEYFAEEVRRQLELRYGKEGLYGRTERTGGSELGVNGGLSVRTTLDPKMQKIARRVLIDGLVDFDRKQGWRGPYNGKRIATTGDWGLTLAGIDIPTDLAPWRLGVVLRVERGMATIGLRPPRSSDGRLAAEREEVDIALEEMKWAKPPGARSAPKSATDVLVPGDVVWVAPKNPDQPNSPWTLMQIPEIGGGLIALDPHTGRVHAVVGGFSFSQSQFDRALQARRQPGSSYKPFVYAAALDNGYKSTSIVLDAPIALEQGPGKEIWSPKNYDTTKSYGPSTLRIGIEKSRNQMTVRLAQDMGMPLIVQYSKRFGVYDDLLPVLAMSLGAGETTLAKLAAGYASFVNGGKQIKYTLIVRIQDRWGRTIWTYDDRKCSTDCNADKWEGQAEPTLPPDTKKQIIDPHTAYQMTSMLEGVVQRGTGTIIRRILGPNVPVAGKTGTTNDEKDAWFVGFTPDLVVGVFIGYDTPRPMGKGMTGGAVAAPIFAHFLKAAVGDKLAVPFRQPSDIRLIRVSLRTGLKATPGEKETVLEAFKPTEEPDDEYSVIGFTNETGTFMTPEQTDPRTIGTGKGLY